jgi:hypothetical protein
MMSVADLLSEEELLALMHFHAGKIKEAEICDEDSERHTSSKRCDRIIQFAEVLKGNYSDS